MTHDKNTLDKIGSEIADLIKGFTGEDVDYLLEHYVLPYHSLGTATPTGRSSKFIIKMKNKTEDLNSKSLIEKMYDVVKGENYYVAEEAIYGLLKLIKNKSVIS